MKTIRWGILGCGAVTEVKSGPGFQRADNSQLVAVMRRDVERAADYARRHSVPRYYGEVDELLADPDVDAVYIGTPPSSHCELALKVACAGKPCLVEKPMAMNHAETLRMVEAFKEAQQALFVAYYRRALPRFLKVHELMKSQVVGDLTSVHIVHYERLRRGAQTEQWRFDRDIAGGGLFMDLASHGLDILDFLVSPIKAVGGCAVNTGGTYRVEDVTAACFEFESGIVGTGIWNFNADHSEDQLTFTGSEGTLECPVFSDTGIVVKTDGKEELFSSHNPPHVHQPLIQSVVDHLLGRGVCESTGESGARTAWVMDQCLAKYYNP